MRDVTHRDQLIVRLRFGTKLVLNWAVKLVGLSRVLDSVAFAGKVLDHGAVVLSRLFV